MKYHLPNAVVIEQVRTDNKIYALTFLAPEIAREAQPGQFVHAKQVIPMTLFYAAH